MEELGPDYLHFAIDTLRSARPQRGYMGHVLGYTVNAVLGALMKVPTCTRCCIASCHLSSALRLAVTSPVFTVKAIQRLKLWAFVSGMQGWHCWEASI